MENFMFSKLSKEEREVLSKAKVIIEDLLPCSDSHLECDDSDCVYVDDLNKTIDIIDSLASANTIFVKSNALEILLDIVRDKVLDDSDDIEKIFLTAITYVMDEVKNNNLEFIEFMLYSEEFKDWCRVCGVDYRDLID